MHQMSPLLAALAAGVLSVSLVTCPRAACPCSRPQTIDALPSGETLVMSAAVATERSSRVTLAFDVGEVSYLEKRVRFVPDSLYRGEHADTIEVLFYEGREACETHATDFIYGQRYLLSARPDPRGAWTSNDCSLLLPLPPRATVPPGPLPAPPDSVQTPDPGDTTAATPPAARRRLRLPWRQ